MPHVFIVEDDEDLRNLYSVGLRGKGYEILDVAIDGVDAIAKYKKFDVKPDVIIMDYRMPNKNGLDTSLEIFNIDKTANIIIASADRNAFQMAKKLGIKWFLEKPFSILKMVKTVDESLENSK